MSWEHFIWFAIAALICWSLGAFAAWKGKKPVWTYGFTLLGLVIFFSFILGMWISLERPPMRTMGETRLWYSFFLPLAGLITYVRWKYKWILSFSCILSLVFICINIFKPEIHNKTLMPALQSPWFAPHVIVYMFAYAMLGAAVVMAVYLLWFKKNLCRLGIYDIGNADGSYLGEGSMGALLGLGPERDMGGSYLVLLSGIYPFQTGQTVEESSGINHSVSIICLITNVLVWNQLSSIGTRS